MSNWDGWPIERLIYLFVGLAHLMMWMQLTLMHYRAAFRKKSMWVPVIITPIIGMVAILYVAMRSDITGKMFVGAYALAALTGLIGTIKHLKGIASQVGGFNLRNNASGPPPILPMMYMAVAAFGLLVYYWPQVTGGRS